jgi:hypothetical protein
MSAVTIPQGWTVAEPRPLEAGWKWVVFFAAVGAAAVAWLGFNLSFHAVARVAVDADVPEEWAWAVPITMDVGMAIAVAVDIVCIRLGTVIRWLRGFADLLAVLTLVANVWGQTTPQGVAVHGAGVIVWIATTHGVAALVRAHVEGPKVRPDRIPWTRWAGAPIQTVRLFRLMLLCGERSYSQALRLEHDRQRAKADLIDKHGRRWKKKANARTLVEYRFANLTPSNPAAAPAAADGSDLVPDPSPTRAPRRTQTRRPAPSRDPQPVGPRLSDEDMDLREKRAREFCDTYRAANEGRWPGRGALIKALKQAGSPCGAKTAAALIEQLQEETP